MNILHAIWLPSNFLIKNGIDIALTSVPNKNGNGKNSQGLTHEDIIGPKLFIWGENTTKTLILLQEQDQKIKSCTIHDGLLSISGNEIDKDLDLLPHQFCMDGSEIENHLQSILENIQVKPQFLTNFEIPLPSYNHMPLYSKYLYWKSFHEPESDLEKQILRLTNSVLTIYQTEYINPEIENFKVQGILISPADLPYILDEFQNWLDHQPNPISQDIQLSRDLEYWVKLYVWVKHQVLNSIVYPQLVSLKEVHKELGVVSNSVSNDPFLGWWYYVKDTVYISKFNEFAQSIPPVECNTINMKRSLPNSEGEKENQEYNLNVVIANPQFIVQDFLNWTLNSYIRFSKVQHNPLDLNLPPSLDIKLSNNLVSRINSAFFSDNPIFSKNMTDELTWFMNQFNNWIFQHNIHDNDQFWSLYLQLIPPEEQISDPWFLTFGLKHKLDNDLIVTIYHIMNSDNLELVFSSYFLKEPVTLLLSKINELIERHSEMRSIHDPKSPFFIQLDNSMLNYLLGKGGNKLTSQGYEIFLPKNLSRKFVSRENIKIEIDINVSSVKGISINSYDLNLLVDNAKVSLSEVLMLAKLKSGLIEVADKWIYFDRDEATKLTNLIEKRLANSNPFDLIKLSAEGLGEETNTTFYGNFIAKSNFFTELSQNKINARLDLKFFQANLRQYQKTGVKWLIKRVNWKLGGILADDMGLGKTIQIIATINDLKNKSQLKKPILIIVPTSVLGNWINELQRFSPQLKYMMHHGLRTTNFNDFSNQINQVHIVITSYNIIRMDSDLFGDMEWQGVIVDEAQVIKNSKTKLHKCIVTLKSEFRFALTGTPIENSLSDLWSLFNYILPGYLGTLNAFKQNFIIPIESEEIDRINILQKLIAPFILRRRKSDPKILTELPLKNEKIVYCAMTKEQIALYKAVVDLSMEKLKSSEGIKRKGVILSSISKLKQICNHPSSLIAEKSPHDGFEVQSGKLTIALDLIQTILENGEKVLIFSQYTKMCKLLHKSIETHFGLSPLYLHGGVEQVKRQEMISKFNTKFSTNSVFIISLRAGGTGLNLEAANHVIHFDRWWNPAVENQATDRVYRIGQTKNVMVYKLVVKGTIEEKINDIIEKKQELSDKIIERPAGKITDLNDEEFRKLLELQSVIELEH